MRVRYTPLPPTALRRVEKDNPFLPGIVQGACQFLDIGHDPEAALGIRVLERIGDRGLQGWRLAAGGQFQ